MEKLRYLLLVALGSAGTLIVSALFEDKEITTQSNSPEIDQPRAKASPFEEPIGDTLLNERIATLESDLIDAQSLISKLKQELEEEQNQLIELEDEFLISYGTVEDLGVQMGIVVKNYMDAMKRYQEFKESGRNWKEMTAEEKVAARMTWMGMFSQWAELSPTFNELDSLADTPTDAAKLQTSFISEIFELDEMTGNAVSMVFENNYVAAANAGLMEAQMPEGDTEEWDRQRNEVNDQIIASLSEYLDNEQLNVLNAASDGNLLNMPDLSMNNKTAMKQMQAFRR